MLHKEYPHVRSYRASHIHVHIIIIPIVIAVAIEARRRCDLVGLSRARSGRPQRRQTGTRSGIGHADAARAATS
jgi:hypothetical protein